MSFQKDIEKFIKKAKDRERLLYKRTVEHAFRSIRFGSSVTGAPGQPVDTTELLTSWRLNLRGNRKADMISLAKHADVIEHNRRGAKLRSRVGGFHSVMRTRLGWHKIVKFELARLGPGGSDGVPSAPIVALKRPRDAKGRFTRRKHAELNIHG